MEPKEYIVARIAGDYAYLQDVQSGEEVFITLALSPEGIDVGTKLQYEMFAYTVI